MSDASAQPTPLRIGVYTHWGAERLLDRLLPANSGGNWSDRHFAAFDPEQDFDWVVVYFHYGLERPVEILGDPANVAYVSTEPYEVASIRPSYLRQFSRVVLTDPRVRHPSIVRQSGMPWWVGQEVDRESHPRPQTRTRLRIDDLLALRAPKKRERISIVTSTAKLTPAQAARGRLIDAILRHPIARHVDVFGVGRRQVLDKLDAILPNAYHLALENCSLPGYWTEKLSDAYLGYALPIYSGCPDLDAYFPSESFVEANVFRPAQVIEALERALDERAWDQRLPHILEARRRVLEDQHPLSIVARVCDRPATQRTRFVIEPWAAHQRGRTARAWWRTKRRVYTRTRDVSIAGRQLWRFPP